MDRRKFLMKMNQKAVFSAVSGAPVTFVDRITDEIRGRQDGPYTDGMNMYDPADPSIDDMDAIFCLTRQGEGQSFAYVLEEIGGFSESDSAFMKKLDQMVFDRDEVEVSLDDDEDDDEGLNVLADDDDDDDEEIELLQGDGCKSINGFAVKVEDIAESEDLIPLVEKCGYAVKDQLIEFMAQHWPLNDEETYGEDMHGFEVFYRITGGDAWIQSCFTLIPGEDVEEYFQQILPAVIGKIKWDKVMDSLDAADESFDVQVGIPVFR